MVTILFFSNNNKTDYITDITNILVLKSERLERIGVSESRSGYHQDIIHPLGECWVCDNYYH